MKNTWYILFALLPGSLMAQDHFQRCYQAGPSYQLDLLELPSGNLLTSIGAGALWVNDQGNIVWANSMFNDITYSAQTFTKVNDNLYYFTTGKQPVLCEPTGALLGLTQPVVGSIDSLGNILQLRSYEFVPTYCRGLPRGLAVTSDKGAVVWGRDQSFYLMRVDSTLAPIWSHVMNQVGGFRYVKELPNGDLIAGMDMAQVGAAIARFDPDGNVLWAKSYFGPSGIVQDALLNPDGSIVLVGMTESYASSDPPSTFQPRLYMLKLTSEGEVLWCKSWQHDTYRWHTNSFARIIPTLDGNYAVLATLGVHVGNFQYRPILLKTDLNGTTLWTSSVGAPGYVYSTSSFVQTRDSSYAFSGIVLGTLPENNTGLNYIMRADQNGQFSCEQQAFSFQSVELFPEGVPITLSFYSNTAEASSLNIPTELIDPALYLNWDLCEIVNTVAPTTEFRKGPRIRPNPTPGRITVELPTPLLPDSFYSVFDATGRLLYERPLPPGTTTTDIDLSRFGTGTYLLRITDPEGQRNERVVVE
jgi:hypothetical protein